MFEARLKEGHILRKIFEAFLELVKEVNIDVSPLGITIRALDTGNVALLSLTLESHGFTAYRCDQERRLGVNVATLVSIMRMTHADAEVILQADDSQLRFQALNPSTGHTFDFYLPLLTLPQAEFNIPEIAMQALIIISTKEFARICRDFQGISEQMRIETQPDQAFFAVKSDKIGQGAIRITNPDGAHKESDYRIELEKPTQGEYPLAYLTQFTKVSGLSPYTELKMAEGQPLVVEYKIEDFGKMQYFLAPKIDSDMQT